MEFSPSDMGKWLLSRIDEEKLKEYQSADPQEKQWHRGQKDAFFECYQMLMGNGPYYVCRCGQADGPYKDLKPVCSYATLIKKDIIKHLKEHHIEYKIPEDYDRLHKFVMKEA